MKLLPNSAYAYDKYWESIREYNRWFISLRNYAAVLLFIFILGLKFLFNFQLNDFQFISLLVANSLIIAVNIYYKRIVGRINSSGNIKGITPLKFSLIQITVDLLILGAIVYLTGGIEAPIFMFFIFHMIIASILLPEKLAYSLAAILIFLFSGLSYLEYSGVIPHQKIEGLFASDFYNDFSFLIGFISVFSLSLLISVKITTKLASDIYFREGELRRTLDELNSAEESKQKFIMGLVHELKSPIAVALTFIDLVLSGIAGKIDNTASEKISKSKSKLRESIDLINSTLRVSQFKLLNKTVREEFDLIELIKMVIVDYKILAKSKNIDLKHNTDEFETLNIESDKILLKLAISNLISNAIKYTPKGGKVRVILTQNDKINIEVSDTGIGIPKEEQAKIFKNYYRAKNAVNNGIEGTGTGLSLVNQIASALNIKLELESPSRIGDLKHPGASFILTLNSNLKN